MCDHMIIWLTPLLPPVIKCDHLAYSPCLDHKIPEQPLILQALGCTKPTVLFDLKMLRMVCMLVTSRLYYLMLQLFIAYKVTSNTIQGFVNKLFTETEGKKLFRRKSKLT